MAFIKENLNGWMPCRTVAIRNMENQHRSETHGAVGKSIHPSRAERAVQETLCLYHAWLGYLLRRLGENEVRVPTAELGQALGRLSCRVRREDGMYVISFVSVLESAGEGAAGAGEARDVGV